MYCQYCGHELQDGSEYCSKCGKPVNNSTDVAGNNKRNLLYIVIAILIITIAILIGLFLNGKKEDSLEDTVDTVDSQVEEENVNDEMVASEPIQEMDDDIAIDEAEGMEEVFIDVPVYDVQRFDSEIDEMGLTTAYYYNVNNNERPLDRIMPYAVDNANMLSDEELFDINQILEKVSTDYDLDIAFVTTPSSMKLGGAVTYASNYRYYYGYGQGNNKDAILLVYDVSNDEVGVSADGAYERCLPDDKCQYIANTVYANINEMGLAEAIKQYPYDVLYAFLANCDDIERILETGEIAMQHRWSSINPPCGTYIYKQNGKGSYMVRSFFATANSSGTVMYGLAYLKDGTLYHGGNIFAINNQSPDFDFSYWFRDDYEIYTDNLMQPDLVNYTSSMERAREAIINSSFLQSIMDDPYDTYIYHTGRYNAFKPEYIIVNSSYDVLGKCFIHDNTHVLYYGEPDGELNEI